MIPVDPSKLDPAALAPDAKGIPGRLPPPAGPADLPPALSTTPTAWGLVKALRRRWLVALVGSLILGALTAAIAYYAPIFPKAGASSIVQVGTGTKNIVFNVDSPEDVERVQKTMIVIAKSPGVLKTALAQPEVAELPVVKEQSDPMGWLEQNLVVDFLAGPGTMKINLKGDRADQLAVVVKAITQSFLTEVQGQEQRARLERLAKVTEAGNKEGKDLDAAKKAFKALIGVDPDADLPPAGFKPRNLELLGIAEADLIKTQNSLAQQQAILETRLKKGPSKADLEAPESLVEEQLETKVASDQVFNSFNQEVAKLNVEIAKIGEVAVDPNAAASKQRRRLDEIARTLDEHKAQLRKAIVKRLEEKNRSQYAADTNKLQSEVEFLKSEDKRLTERVTQLTNDTRLVKKAEPDLDKQRADLVQRDKMLNKLIEQEKELKVELQAPSKVALLLEAGPAPRDDKKQQQLAGIAGLGMMGLSLFGISFWEFRARRVQSPDEVTQGLGMRVLGAVPRLPDNVRRQLGDPDVPTNTPWHGALNESIDVVRTLLLHAAQSEGLKVVMVTSALEGEGKTSLASQLAASLARSGRRTLLVDCDLRKPTAHRLFGLPLEPGFCELLRSEVDVEDAIKATRLARLCLVPAGICDTHATQALGQEAVPSLLREFRSQFDFVIIDSAPVLPVADSLQIGQHVDGVILSILNDESRLPKVHAAQQRLTSLGVRVFGAVISGARSDNYGSQYQKIVKPTAS